VRLLAIDVASHKCGLAYFESGILKQTKTVETKSKTPLGRRLEIANYLKPELSQVDVAISEEPFLQGRNNTGMQRLLGSLEFITFGTINFVHPLTVKEFCGSGKFDKLEVALAAGEMLQTEEEKEIMARAIDAEDWDSTDAIAIGLYYLRRVQ
jgi:hypothetical protein